MSSESSAMSNQTLLNSLKTEHEALVDIDMEDYDHSERADRISYFEQFYIGDFTLKLLENLRFYRRKKGKRAGQVVSLYVNPKTGKAQSANVILQKYLDNPEPTHSPAVSLKQRIDKATHLSVEARTHLYNHIVARLKENQTKTLKKLRKEKQ